MNSTAGLPPQRAAELARSDRGLGRSLRVLHLSADDAIHHRGLAKTAVEEKKALAERHPEFAAADLRNIAVHWVMALVPLAIWIIDIVLLSSVSEYLAILMFPGRPQLVLATRLVVAFAVVMVELALSTRLHEAYERADETESFAGVWVSWFGAVGWALFISACLIATQQASGAGDEASTRTLMYGLAGFTLLLHLLLPFSHRLLYDAKGYLLFFVRDHHWKGRDRRARAAEMNARRHSTLTFQHYARDLNRHNTEFPQRRISAGPFSNDVRTLINEIFGEGTIPLPNVPAQSDTASQPPEPLLNSNHTGQPAGGVGPGGEPADEAEYLHTVLTRRQR
jgi:hypothetical protein